MIGNITTIEKIIIILLVVSIVIGFFFFRYRSLNDKKIENGKLDKELSNKKDNNDKNSDKDNSDKNEILSVEIPKGARLTGFHINHIGMAMEPHYVIKSTEKGVYLKLTNMSPDDWIMTEGDGFKEDEGNGKYFRFADVVKDCESGEIVFLEDDTVVKELEEFIVKVGAISWDGYNEHVSMSGILDAGDSYTLYMEFSDGTTVSVYGYNSCPIGFDELRMKTVEIFDRYFEY